MAASRLVMLPPAALLVGIALFAWAWWSDRPADAGPSGRSAQVTASSIGPARATPKPLPEPTAAPAPSPASGPNPAVPTGLWPLLNVPEAGLRAAVDAALKARAQGGRLYARALARRCATFGRSVPAEASEDINDPRHQRALARQAALAAGCSQFTASEWLALVNVAATEPTADDPLLSLLDSDADGTTLLQAVLARPDPLLLDELGARLLLRRIGGEPVLYFDGERFDDDARRALAEAALRLLPCHFGLACDERDPEVWQACLRGERCLASRGEALPPAAQALAARLAAAVRGRELGRFLPPP